MRLAALYALGALLLGCSPGQWSIEIFTDAKLPQLGDRILIEVLDEQGQLACEKDCSHELQGVEKETWPITLGILRSQSETEPRYLRARLLRTITTSGKLQQLPALLDTVGLLPQSEVSSGKLGVGLLMECFGIESRLTPGAFQTCDPTTGALAPAPMLVAQLAIAAPPVPGSWLPGRSVPCAGEVPPGMVCVPGGGFVMGSQSSFGLTQGGNTYTATTPESLVVVSPLAIDKHEFSVKDWVSLKAQCPSLSAPVARGGIADPDKRCAFTATAADADSEAALNCISWQQAQDICECQGKRLPTEAEWEYVAGNRDNETKYPFAASHDLCSTAVIARSCLSLTPQVCLKGGDTSECLLVPGKMLEVGPLPIGRSADVSQLGVHDLAGNLSEWVEDDQSTYGDLCWGRIPLLRRWLKDPRCNQTDLLSAISVVRGGSWQSPLRQADVAQRDVQRKDLAFNSSGALDRRYHGIGLRCVKQLATDEPRS